MTYGLYVRYVRTFFQSVSDLNDDISQLFPQLKLSDLIRDLKLTKDHGELLPSRLKEKNVQKGIKISLYYKRSQNVTFFQMENELCY